MVRSVFWRLIDNSMVRSVQRPNQKPVRRLTVPSRLYDPIVYQNELRSQSPRIGVSERASPNPRSKGTGEAFGGGSYPPW